ncbi:class I SAM-dependent methyltransferase [Arthrobacter sp. ATA002]|uniref:class I SAM-dependent methyltransferase n=1 Tax=Arthrobacter sp. ATA002 TaxID=2991715 RepID=UPI0022A7CC37|nr:class I SAM-dependent methyltransferase [Arthrobacter sp. ATA002]WAP50510.1 class I SAM-dependent methyltransferase [Arthrobacter sp. ATA002]
MEHAGESHSREHTFDKDYWERHWQERGTDPAATPGAAPNPHVVRETAGLVPGTALDAGCGTGTEALWLAARGWRVVGADISAAALAEASAQTAARSLAGSVSWVEADLVSWAPEQQFDLVVASYAHPAIPQLAFYRHISEWVAPGGTLLIVGHLHAHSASHRHGDAGQRPPIEATAGPEGITAQLDSAQWKIITAEEQSSTPPGHRGGNAPVLNDVVVRAVRQS